MASLNVHIHAYGDCEMARGAIESIPDDVPVYVLDGRYADFDGDTNLTPGLEGLCASFDNCAYHAPPAEMLPFGADAVAPPEWRAPIYEKATWANQEVLPQDEFTLKLDTDERLVHLDLDFDAIDKRGKFAPQIHRPDDPNGNPHITRLWQPRYWTAWIDDCILPRSTFPRETSLEQLARIWLSETHRKIRFHRRQCINSIYIQNLGHERPTEYRERRLDHLEHIGRADRAKELRQTVGPKRS